MKHNQSTVTPLRRLAAIATLICFASAVVVLVIGLASNLVSLIIAVLLLPLVTVLAFRGLVTSGTRRWLYLAIAAAAAIGLFYLMSATVSLSVWNILLLVALIAAFWLLADVALPEDITFLDLDDAPDEAVAFRPKQPTLIMNRWSGGGKVEQFDIEAKARALGIKTVMLEKGDDLAQLARDAITQGADAIGMAGGDGSLGLVAKVAIDHDVPFVCIPAGTRNHFARDMGLDRTDPSLALAAFSGREVRIDYALVGDRVFLNNVSLGLYAAAVHQPGYRENKLGTMADMLPQLSGGDGSPLDMQFTGPDGERHNTAQLVLISNNQYDLTGSLLNIGKRFSINEGTLGIAALSVTSQAEIDRLVALATVGKLTSHPGWLEWETDTFEVGARTTTLAAGIDGEAVDLPVPILCRSVPEGLRVLLPEGASPGARQQPSMFDRNTLVRLGRVAAGSDVAE